MSEHAETTDLEALDLERMHEREREHQNLGWPAAMTVALIGGMILSMLLFLPMFGHPTYVAGRYDATSAVPRVVWETQVWKPNGPLVTVPDGQMIAVARSNEGHLLYSRTGPGAPAGGGGGAAPQAGAGPAEYRTIFIRRGLNQYQPMTLTNPGAPRRTPVKP